MEALHFYILLLGIAWSIFNKYVIPKIRNLPPTPFSALTIIGYRIIFKQPMHKTLAHISNRHGPILLLRFGFRRVLLISSSSAAEDLFSNNDRVFANRPKLLPGKIFGCNYSTLAWAPHGALWRHLRRASFIDVLKFHRLHDQQDSLADEVKVLLHELFHSETKIVDFKSIFQDLVFKVMVRMFAGKRYSQKKITAEGETTESNSLKEYVMESFRITTGETDTGYFMPILKALGLMNALEERCKKLQEKGDSLLSRLIEELRPSIAEFSNQTCETEEKVLNFLLARQKDDPKNYRDDIIKGLMLGLMTAGTTTSAGTMEWAISLLIKHPEVLQKAQTEIDNYVGNNRFLKLEDLEHLPYLRCIVKETMRLYPVAPLLVPHESSKKCKVGGYNVPKGTMLMVNVWAIQNDPNIWKQPTEFIPERFEKIVDERDGFKLMPFGYGMRSCPGKHMALRVIHYVLGSLIQCFDWEPVSQEMINLTEQTGIALLKEDPLKLVCRPRPTMKNLLSQT
uniref:cytochrome P450 81Q32-like n=1 Tax=Erigeron canadensis TaxID=72917 RepID=UPI001CB93536|nr:cytochrome P450 81Q32-like [Erigeron canadensis]